MRIQDEIDIELSGDSSEENVTKDIAKKEPADPKQNLQQLLQRQANFLKNCRQVKVRGMTRVFYLENDIIK